MAGDSDIRHLGFLRRLPITLVAAMLLWLILRGTLDLTVPRFTEIMIRSFEYPRVTRLVATEHWVEIRRADFRAGSAIPKVSLTEVHFNTIILLALYLAMPRPFSRTQLERLLMGWCTLYLIQCLNLLFHVKTVYAIGLGEWSVHNYSPVARNVFAYLQYFTDLPVKFSSPFLIWLGFNWDDVMVMLGVARGTPAAAKKTRRRAKKA
jgi:hypothetical protein